LKLNARQKSFCEFYVASGNATESAIKAGYKEKYAGVNADKLLKNTNVSKYIKRIMEEHTNNRIAKAEEILEFLTATLRGEFTDKVEVEGVVPVMIVGESELEE